MPGAAHRLALQQSVVRLRRLLPAQDTKQLFANYDKVPQNLVGAIVDANRTRKDFAAEQVVERVMALVYGGVGRPLVDVYRLTMKSGATTSARARCRAS